MEDKFISTHLKKEVDDLVEQFGVDHCLRRAVKLNDMNYKILEHHIVDNNEEGVKSVTEHIRVNETAFAYLQTLKTNTNDK